MAFDEPQTTLAARLLRWGLVALLAAWLHGLVDTALLGVRQAGPLYFAADAVLTTLVAVAALSAVALLAALALALTFELALRATRRPRLAAASIGLLATIPLWALNTHFLVAAPLWYWLGLPLASAGVAAAVVVGAGASSRWRRGLLAALALVAVGAFYVNAITLRGLYRPQHATLTLVSVAATAWALGLVLRRRPAARTVAIVGSLTAVVWLQAFVFLPADFGQINRWRVFKRTVETGHALDAVGWVADLDGDGSAALLGGGDCDDLDDTIHPGAADLPDDGIDQDCIGGDVTQAALDALGARLEAFGLPARDRPAAPRSLIVISVDALRVDAAATMQSVQRLAAAGVTFERAYTPYPSTILGVYATFTGRAPRAVQTRRHVKWEVPAPDTSETLAEVLAARGYHTVGLFFHHVFAPELGLTRGFEQVWTESGDPDVVVWGRSSEETADRAIGVLDAAAADPARPLFLWVHFYDPHEPYIEHPEFPIAGARDLRALYDGEVRYTDRHVLRLVEHLQAGGWPDRAVVVLTADHGEALGEHGRTFHASALTEEQVRVPLVVLVPGLPGGQRRELAVSLVGLAPTLAELIGAPRPRDAQAGSFGALVVGGDAAARGLPPLVFTEVHVPGARQWAVIEWPWKLRYNEDHHFFYASNLDTDPDEKLNFYELMPERAQRLEALLGTWIARVRSPPR